MADNKNEDEIETDESLEAIDVSGETTPVISGDTPEWFTGADGQILFVMYTGLVLTPSIIAENSDVSRVTVSRRLNTLQAAGYVEKVDRGKYKITKDGAFLVSQDPDIYRSDSDSAGAENSE